MKIGLIESFFDSLGIIIIIDHIVKNNMDGFYFSIYNNKICIFSTYNNYYTTKPKSRAEAKIAAVYKAFEIAEEMEDKK